MAPGPGAHAAVQKLRAVLAKNAGFAQMQAISAVLDGDVSAQARIGIHFTPAQLSHFKYAPITTCDVERSFSRLKLILTERRRSFSVENFRMYFIAHCNTQETEENGKK